MGVGVGARVEVAGRLRAGDVCRRRVGRAAPSSTSSGEWGRRLDGVEVRLGLIGPAPRRALRAARRGAPPPAGDRRGRRRLGRTRFEGTHASASARALLGGGARDERRCGGCAAGTPIRQAPGVAASGAASAAARSKTPSRSGPGADAPPCCRDHAHPGPRGQAARRRGPPTGAGRRWAYPLHTPRHSVTLVRAPPDLSADERHRPLARAAALVAGHRHLGRPRGPTRRRGVAPRRAPARGGGPRPCGGWPAATPGRSPP